MDVNNKTIVEKSPLPDETPNGKSGLILCALTNLNPLMSSMEREGRRIVSTRSGRPRMPGRFIREMLRARAETAGGGCGGLDPTERPDETRAACHTTQRLCIVCRLFGMTAGGGGAGKHRGNVKVSDAVVREDASTATVNRARAATPDAPGRGACLAPGLRFHFDVQFSNLRGEELELLIHALTVEDHASVEIETDRPASTGRIEERLGERPEERLGEKLEGQPRNRTPRPTIACQLTIHELIYFAPVKTRVGVPRAPKSTLYQGEALKNELSLLTRASSRTILPPLSFSREGWQGRRMAR